MLLRYSLLIEQDRTYHRPSGMINRQKFMPDTKAVMKMGRSAQASCKSACVHSRSPQSGNAQCGGGEFKRVPTAPHGGGRGKSRYFVAGGGLISYGPDPTEPYRRPGSQRTCRCCSRQKS